MRLRRLELPNLYPAYDDKTTRTVVLPLSPAQPVVAGGQNYWVVEDPRPTKAEAKKKIKEFRETRDRAVEFFTEDLDVIGVDPEPILTNIPWWVWVPFYTAPYVAEELIEWDPLDRLED